MRIRSKLIPSQWLLPVAALLLAACQSSTEPDWTVDAFQLPAESEAGNFRVQEKSVVRIPADLSTIPEDERVMVSALTDQGIQGSAYWRYWLPESQGRGFYKLKLIVFDSRSSAEAGWAYRYPPDALDSTQPLAVGDDGYVLPGRMAGFRLDRLIAEIEAGGDADDLEAFVQAYAAFARRKAGVD